MKLFDQDLCNNLRYELNPRVRCAFGNVLNSAAGVKHLTKCTSAMMAIAVLVLQFSDLCILLEALGTNERTSGEGWCLE